MMLCDDENDVFVLFCFFFFCVLFMNGLTD